MALVQEQVRAPRVEIPSKSPKTQERHEAQPRRKTATWANGISLSACCIASFAAVWMVATKGAEVYQLNDANTHLQSTISQQSAENASLSTKVAKLEQPSRILNVAINKLHMQYKTPLVIPSTSIGQ